MCSNTLLIQTVYQGGNVGPAPLNSYPPDYGDLGLKNGKDALGYPSCACGSYAMWMMQYTNRITSPYSVMGYAAQWPANAPEFVVPSPAPGLIAIRPSVGTLPDGTLDLGHALFIEAVLPDGTMLTSSYNSDEQGDYALAIWAPSGEFNGVPVSLVYMEFPAADV